METKRVRYVGRLDEVEVATGIFAGVTVARGQAVVLPATIADGLLIQGWSFPEDGEPVPVDPQWAEAPEGQD